MMNTRRWMVCSLLPVATLGAIGIAGEPVFEISRSTVDGGGAMRSTGGGLELSGTIGQPDAGVLTGGGFELSAGFWFPVSAGDHNDDGLVDLVDYDAFEGCMTGPEGGEAGPDCGAFDVDHSGAIDLADFAVVQTTFNGG